MRSNSHPQAKFDPLPPDLDLPGLIDRTSNFKWVQRVSRSQIRNLGPQEFEKLVTIHVVLGGKPLVIDGWDSVLSRSLFNVDWLEKTYDKKQENVRDIPNATDILMTTGHYLRSMEQLTNQWTPNTFRDERRQRLYLKDIDCPDEWRDALQKLMHPNLFYLNENVTSTGMQSQSELMEDIFRNETMAAPAGDLMSSLPEEMRAQNLMCYIGHEGTYTPAHREMCASLGQNIMVEASGEGNGEKPGSSIWFMTESKDREVVREYFLSMLGHDIEIEKHFAQINAWKKAPFDVYIVEQRAGDFILIPPLAAHQVWNRGTRTMKVAWNRTTVETLDLALHEALPKARLVCRDEQYKNKAIIYYTLQKYYRELQALEGDAELGAISFIGLGQDVLRNSPRTKQLASDFKRLFGLFTEILVDEVFAYKEKDVEFLPFDSCVTCSYCRSNIFNRFLTCKHCVRPLLDGEEDAYDVCMECYAMGRSCACLSGLKWCEQWSWSELVDSYETWRAMVIMNDGFVDIDHSPQPLEIVRKRAGKKSLAQICQEALRRRPWKDIMKPEREKTPSDSEPEGGDGKSAKKGKRKKKKGDLLKCHVCCHRDFSYKVHTCTNPGCNEGYCYGVLYRAFDLMPQKVLEDEHWQCPKCLGICNCGACRRAKYGNPYTPKNTTLGHDTRRVADDRSVEALVDFRVHNLAWLKAAGEESRDKDSRRMQRLREQADNAKAQDSTEQQEAERRMTTNMTSEHHDNDSMQQDSATNGYGDQSHVLGYGNVSQSGFPYPASEGEDAANRGAMANDRDIAAKQPHDVNDDTLYPDPSDFALRRRIGLGYYEQDDTPDKILFDPYMAPSTEFSIFDELDELDQHEVPEFVKKSIRAAKRKARRENEDPDFVISRSHNKKPRLVFSQPADFLDNMDPALFQEDGAGTPSVPMAVGDPMGLGETGEPASEAPNDQERPPQKKLWFDANEPELRHSKPRASYIELEDVEVDEEEEEAPAPAVLNDAKDATENDDGDQSAMDLAAKAVTSLLARRNPQKTRAGSPKKRGRPPRRPSMENLPDEPDDLAMGPEPAEPVVVKRKRGRPPKKSLSSLSAVHEELSHEPSESAYARNNAGSEEPNDADDRGADEDRRSWRARRRRSGVTTIAAGSMDYESESDNDGDFQPPIEDDEEQRQPKRRGRPRRSGFGSNPPVGRRSPPRNTQFMSMRERMALQGKSFKFAKRKSRAGPAATPREEQPREARPKEDLENKEEKEGGAGLLIVAISPGGNAEAAHGSKRSKSPTHTPGATVVSLSEVVPEVDEKEFWSNSDDSNGDEDIPNSSNFIIRITNIIIITEGGVGEASSAMLKRLVPGLVLATPNSEDSSWHAPSQTQVNNLSWAIKGTGTGGFIYNSSTTPDAQYGTYNHCNMPHVRRREYVKPPDEYELKYVELMHRHHKRTPYPSNGFPVESYPWDCDDARVYVYGQPVGGHEFAPVYRQGYVSEQNPFAPSGWTGTCQFPQITHGGLQDSWQHGDDLYAVYHSLLGLLPARGEDFGSRVKFRVTNNPITSQVAGMVMNGMWNRRDAMPLLIQAVGVDSLEPQYPCPSADSVFSSIRSNASSEWKRHLEAAEDVFRRLDGISGVDPSDDGFHASFDHYFDNLSARQCHGKPLPCRLVDGRNSTDCVSQDLADAVYRLGNWEYSRAYRDDPASLRASAASLGVWIGELTSHLRDVMSGRGDTVYFHNVAHDGSMSRLLSILQVDEMVWPGMGAEIIFELYAKDVRHEEGKFSSLTVSSQQRQMGPSTTERHYYLRILFGGRILTSSNPILGRVDMLPVEMFLTYMNDLMGKGASSVKEKCQTLEDTHRPTTLLETRSA